MFSEVPWQLIAMETQYNDEEKNTIFNFISYYTEV